MRDFKDWSLFVGTILAGFLFVVGLIVANIYLQKWIHSPVCNCACEAKP